jgi:nitrite reductase/ring-hydroxylating ferredoxin subunit
MKSKIHDLQKNKLLLVSRKILILLSFFPFLFGCDAGNINYNNPNIPNYPVNLQLNLSLPQYSNLQFPSNHIVDYSQGARGIVVFNTGSGYTAFDLACPNQSYASCTSPMTINGIDAKCVCDNASYSLFSGQSPGKQYPMKPYRVEISGGNLVIYN